MILTLKDLNMKHVFLMISLLLIAIFPTISAAGIKNPPAGLIMRGKTSTSYCDLARGETDGGYCQIAWRDLEPSEGVYDFSLIDNAIEVAKAYNVAHNQSDENGFKVLLRIRTGVYTPSWVTATTGSIPWYFKDFSTIYTLPLFWESEFQAKYKILMQKLADRYDTNPVVGAVAASMCMTAHTEIMWNRTGRTDVRSTNMSTMRAAKKPNGSNAKYTNEKDKGCLRNQVNIHRNTWKTTPTIFGSHLYQQYNYKTGGKIPNYTKTIEIFNYCMKTLGKRCMLGNNSLLHTENNTGLNINKAISYVAAQGYPTYYQSHVYNTKEGTAFDYEDLKKAIKNIIHWKAIMIELPMGWDCYGTTTSATGCSDAQAKSLDLRYHRGLLKKNLFPAVGLANNGSIWIYNDILKTWHTIPGNLDGKIDTNYLGEIWGTTTTGNIYYKRNYAQKNWTKASKLVWNPTTKKWHWLTKKFIDVTIADNGTAWALDTSGTIYTSRGYYNARNYWIIYPGRLTNISAGIGGNTWGISSNNKYYYRFAGNTGWTAGELGKDQISVGSDGTIWAIDSNDYIYTKTSTYANWITIGGRLTQISSGYQNVWGVNSHNSIYRRSGARWLLVPGALVSVSAR